METRRNLTTWIILLLTYCLYGLSLQAQPSTNAHNGMFFRGTGTNATFHSLVLPLDFQKGIQLDDIDGNSTNLFPIGTWPYTRYHYDALQPASSTNISLRIPYKSAIAAFGSRVGGTPLYTQRDYKFGIYSGFVYTSNATPTIYLYALDPTDGSAVSLTNVYLPYEFDPNPGQWDEFATNGYSRTVTFQGLTTTVKRLAGPRWGSSYRYSYLLTHRAEEAATNYIFLVYCLGYTEGSWMSTWSSGGGTWTPMYTVEFEEKPPWRSAFLDQPHFEGEPLPSTYYDKSLEELMATTPAIPSVSFGAPSNYLQLDHSPELRQHPILDRFVEDMGDDPIALANYVSSQIELTDAMDYDTNQNASAALNLSGIRRSALGVFQEKQGSPLEQCALLVYLLRQAGVPAAYVDPSTDGLSMLDQQVSRLLGVQLREAVHFAGSTNDLPDLIPANYPWVAAYLTNESRWVHIFPWIKDVELVEGLNLYDWLPQDYNSGYKWMLKYLEQDTNIMSLSAETDQPSVLFPRFIEQSLHDHSPGISLDDMGITRNQRQTYHLRWDDFPKPFSLSGTPTVRESFQGDLDWFDTLQVRVSSANNTNVYVDTGELRIADIHNRRLLLRFEQIGTQNSHRMILSLAPYHPGITNKGVFGGNPSYALAVTNTLQSSDNALRYRVIHRRLKNLGAGYTAPSFLTNYYEYLYDELGQQKLGIEYDKEEKPFRKGDLVALCLDTGRVTERMLRVHAEELWQFERTSPGTPDSERDPEVFIGASAHLMGMSYWESLDRFRRWNEDIHKVKTLGSFAYGFSVIKPKRDGSGNLVTNGMVIPVQPHLHMPGRAVVSIYNGTARADSGQDYESAHWDYRMIEAVQASAAEHGAIESFFNTNAVSSIRLLHLGGPANFLRLTKNNFSSYQSQISSADASMWTSVSNWFNTGSWTTNFSQAFVTHANITDGSYVGMGALMIQPYGIAALISGLLNGGAGQPLPEAAFSAENADLWRLIFSPEGSLTSYTFSQEGANSDGSFSFLSSQYQEGATYDLIGSLFPDPQAATEAGLINSLFGELGGGLDTAFFNTANFGPVDTHTSYSGDLLGLIADPVNAVTGEHYVDTVDLRLNGPMPLEVRRNYSSLNLTAGQFGYGWKINLVPHLTVITNGLILAAEPDGAVIAYTPCPTNADLWLPVPDHNPNLNNTSVGGVSSMANPLNARIEQETVSGTNVYRLFRPDGSVRRYETRAFQTDPLFTHERPYLVEWLDHRGNSFTFAYQDDITLPGYGQVRRVQSSSGDFLGFYHDVFGQIVEAYTGDGRRLFYEYDKTGDLTRVTLPDGSERTYEYRHDTYVTNSVTRRYSTHLLSREIKPDSRVLESFYDSHRRVVTQKATVGPDLKTYTNAVFVYSNNFDSASPDSPVHGHTLVLDAFGNTSRYDYTNNLLTKITDPFENALEQDWYWETDGSGGFARSLKWRRDKRGLLTEYRYDSQGNATNVTMGGDLTGDGTTNDVFLSLTTYTNALPLQTSNSVGQVIKFLYADTNYPYLPTSVETWSSNTLVSATRNTYYATNSNGWSALGLLGETIRAYETADAATNRWFHNGRGLLTSEIRFTGTTDPAVTNEFTYNQRAELVERTDAAGRINRFGYDALGRPTVREVFEAGETVPLGWNYSYYNENGELTWSDGPRYDPEDYIWRDYDGAGRQITEIRWRSQARSDGTDVEAAPSYDLYATAWSEYDAFGNLTRSVNPRSAITTNNWDALGRLVQTKSFDLDGTTVLTTEGFAYEPGGQVARHTNALGGITETLYTSTGQPKFRQNPDGSTNAWRYYADGRVQREIQRNGAYWETTYDDASRTITKVFRNNAGTALATNITLFDRRGNATVTTDAGGNSFTSTFDGLDRLKSSAGPVLMTITASGMDPVNPTFITNFSQQVTTRIYDASGKTATVTNALGDKTITTRDALGRTVKVEVRNAANDLVRTTSTGYSADHHSVTVTNGSGAAAIVSTTFSDTLGQPVLSIAYPSTNTREFTLQEYDLGSNLVYEERDSATNSTVTTWSSKTLEYDGLNRLTSLSELDDAVTTFDYDLLGNVTNRAMPGGLDWQATYNSAGQMLSEVDRSGAQSARGTTYSYYPDGNDWAGLLKTVTDGRSVTRTNSYDDFLRVATVGATGPQAEQQMTLGWQYDARGLLTNATLTFASTNTGPATRIDRHYNEYSLLTGDAGFLNDAGLTSVSQGWDAVGRRTAVGSMGFQYRADGLISGMNGGTFGYGDNGLLTGRTNAFRSMTVNQRDGAGRLLQTTTKVGLNTVLKEDWSWTGDGMPTTYTATRSDFTDTRHFNYGALHRRLTNESLTLGTSQSATNFYTFDNGTSGGLGVITKVGPTAGLAAWTGGVDAFSRIGAETNTVLHRTAVGTVNGPATLRGDVDGRPVDFHHNPSAAGQWSAGIELLPGTNTLTVYADHPSTQFTTNKVSVFTVDGSAVDKVDSLFDSGGYVTNRVWRNSLGQTVRSQALVWDAFGRLVKVTERDASTNGFNWQADFDPLGRRLRTTTVPVTNGVVLSTQPRTLIHVHDPSVEFQEIGVSINGLTTWKNYGPDLDGRYGGQMGLGGLESLTTGSSIVGIVQDGFGNVLGGVSSGAMTWNAARSSLFGPAEGYPAVSLSVGSLTSEHLGWRGKWRDETGLFYWGARPYDAVRRNFLSADPLGHGSDPGLYAAFGGNPAVYWDPDGRIAKAGGRFIGDNLSGLGQLVSDAYYSVGYAGVYPFSPDTAEAWYGQSARGLANTVAGTAQTTYDLAAWTTYAAMEPFAPDFAYNAYGGSMARVDQMVPSFYGGEDQSLTYQVTYGTLTAASMFLPTRLGTAGRSELYAGRAGSFAELDNLAVVGDNLTPHHMPQAALGFTSRAEGGAIVLPQSEHVLTRTYGFGGAQLAQQEAGLPFRTVFARDIRDLRGIAGSQYNQGIQDLIWYYEQNFPELIAKPTDVSIPTTP